MDIATAFAAAKSKDASENSGVLDSWVLSSHTEKEATINLGDGLGELVISFDEDGAVLLDFNNEDFDLGDGPGMFLADVIGKCAEDLENSPAESIAAAILRVFKISGKELTSSDARHVFTMEESDDFAEEYEPEMLVSKETQWLIELKTTLLRKAEEAGQAEKVLGLSSATPGKKVSSIFSEGAAAKILVSDFISMMKESQSLGYTVEAVDDNIYVWRVRIHEVKRESPLFSDLNTLERKMGYRFIEVQMSFSADLYPFYPPLVTLVRPRFEGFMLGKLASVKSIQLSNWDPVWGPRDVVQNIIMELELNGRIELDSPLNSFEENPVGSYSTLEHLLLKLSLVTEVAPRCQFKESTLVCEADLEAAKKKRRQVFRVEQPLTSSSSDAVESRSEVTSCHIPSLDATNTDGAEDSDVVELAGKAKPGRSVSKHLKADKENRTFWAKGTGYGTRSDASSTHWNPEQQRAQQAEKDRLQIEILSAICEDLSYQHQYVSSEKSDKSIECRFEWTPCRLYAVLEESCIVPYLQSLLSNESLLDMEEHSPLYQSCFNLLDLICNFEWIKPLLGHLESQEHSLQDSAVKMLNRIDIFMRRTGGQLTGSSNSDKIDISYIHSVLMVIKTLSIQAAPLISATSTKIADTDGCSVKEQKIAAVSSKDDVSIQKQYTEVMRALQYQEVDTFSEFKYTSQLQTPGGGLSARVKRLAQEHADISTSLPLSWSSSVWLCALSSRMDAVQVMISGPEGTPYQNGIYVFDVYFPDTYPSNPPLVNLRTTGGGSFRFNPNLYNCGKVCLSLLGTWSGGEGEGWIAGTSTFLQVLVSIQSLIFVPEPYFNEPGYESSMGTPDGTRQSISYSENIRDGTVRIAMIDQLRNPPKGFEEVTRNHFLMKRDEIVQQLDTWVAESRRLKSSAETLKSLLKNLK